MEGKKTITHQEIQQFIESGYKFFELIDQDQEEVEISDLWFDIKTLKKIKQNNWRLVKEDIIMLQKLDADKIIREVIEKKLEKIKQKDNFFGKGCFIYDLRKLTTEIQTLIYTQYIKNNSPVLFSDDDFNNQIVIQEEKKEQDQEEEEEVEPDSEEEMYQCLYGSQDEDYQMQNPIYTRKAFWFGRRFLKKTLPEDFEGQY